MFLVVTYDIDTTSSRGKKRLHEVAKLCESIGNRVQYSVFEMQLNPRQLDRLKYDLMGIIDARTDSVRFYRLGDNPGTRISTIGRNSPYSFSDDYIV